MSTKVFVGISGGVDSSVTAALLKDQGHEVIGVFIRTWQPDFIECTWRNERRDAMRVCAHLGIPFVELDLEHEYRQGVADYMIAEYKKGRTPNPDVMCNKEVKFGGFLRWALKNNGRVATGHYAQNIGGELVKGLDPSKDQSYFLWTLTTEQLQHILFPVGHLQKSEVRTLAEQYKLPTAIKKDSQGICFLGDINMKDFLSHYIENKSGDVLNEQAEVIGHHDGALFFTLGERHGFTITKKGTDDKPYYVIDKNIDKNTITVSQAPETVTRSHQIMIDQCVWRTQLVDMSYTAQIRYHGALHSVKVRTITDDQAEVVFENPEYSLTSGQSVVIYDGNLCVGGGIVI